MSDFIECDTCAAKPGAPHLCAPCVRNRYTIRKLEEALEKLQKTKQMLDWIKERLDKPYDSRE